MPPPVELQPWLFPWLLVTLGHFLLTWRQASVIRGRGATADDLWFDTMVAGTGSLAVVVHLTAATSSLGFVSGAGGLAAWHLALAACFRGGRTGGGMPVPTQTAAILALEVAAAAVLTGITLAWIGTAADSFAVTGADAAHYHVPVAMNLALGASPLDLPATPHLYPMTMSAIVAWFVLPTADLLLVDLAMALPFLLLVASTGLLFRLTTGTSGLALMTWPVLALFATPMLRASSLVSADLLFAAAFAACLVLCLRIWRAESAGAWDIVLIGLAAGLLVGSKATGLPAAALLFAATASLFVFVVTRRRHRPVIARPAAWLGAALLAAGGGGIWLIRNWILFGSPIAPNGLQFFGLEILPGPPFEATTYLSVLGDAEADAGYAPAARAAHYIGEWFGAAYLPFVLLGVLVPIDAWLARRRTVGRSEGATRLAFAGLLIVVGVPLVTLLIGAPWTSLEWTNGYSLRYALPVAVLLPVLAVLAFFPLSWRWFDRPVRVFVAGVALAGSSLWLTWVAQQAGGDSPRLDGVLLTAGLAAVLLMRRADGMRLRRPLPAVAIGITSLAFAFLVTPAIASRSETLRESGNVTMGGSGSEVVAAVLDAEAAGGVSCATRRFFAITRFDQPLALQSDRVPNAQVFYAARDVEPARRAGPLGACDYIIATRAVLATIKGDALVTALFPSGRVSELADAGPFVVLGRR